MEQKKIKVFVVRKGSIKEVDGEIVGKMLKVEKYGNVNWYFGEGKQWFRNKYDAINHLSKLLSDKIEELQSDIEEVRKQQAKLFV